MESNLRDPAHVPALTRTITVLAHGNLLRTSSEQGPGGISDLESCGISYTRHARTASTDRLSGLLSHVCPRLTCQHSRTHAHNM